ncbi:MAG: ORF6N domain-containing protein [Fibrobacter sp.]|nr:ORF6N domain-containing protein [Fibrobacter sp.]MBR2468529.1 ORF6N domain-containing protein [Fibrobacter sp.]
MNRRFLMKNGEKPLEPTAEDMPIARQILVIRDKQVMLDRDLATLYGVETKRINEQVKRNKERFPEDFCFQIDKSEFKELVANCDRFNKLKHSSSRSFAFTEQGIAMLSSVLKSETAIRVNIAIMRAFVAARQILMQNGGLVNRLSNVESKMLEQDARLLEHDHKFDTIFETMDRNELKSKGLYYNNQMFDAYVFVCGLIKQAKRRIVLVDRYVDEKVLAMMLKRAEGVSATIYTYDKSKVFEVDLATYNAQYADCPLKVLPSYGMHDRFLFVDDTAYHFGASLKDLGTNTFFFTKEDFTLEEVLKKSEEKRIELEQQPR